MMRIERIEPVGAQESVWDYPRPPSRPHPRDEPPPTFYLPLEDPRRDLLRPADGASFCEWKGAAAYVDVVVGARVAREAGWCYLEPSPRYVALRDHGFLRGQGRPLHRRWHRGDTPARRVLRGLDHPDVAGPFKGEPGIRGW
jgi:Domain of unknown function (DUF427)